jgi:hypothetical protein
MPWINESETFDVNPLKIHLHRANTLRKYRNMPLLFEPEEIATTSIAFSKESSPIPRISRSLKPHIQTEVTIRRHHDFNFHINLNTSTDISQVQQTIEQSILDISTPPVYPPSLLEHASSPPVSFTQSSLYSLPSSVNPRKPVLIPRKSRDPETVHREININGNIIEFTNADISWPTGIINYSNRVSQLFRDWHESSIILLKGVPVPLKYWGQLFHRVNSSSWQTFKKDYSQQKVGFSEKSAHYLYILLIIFRIF